MRKLRFPTMLIAFLLLVFATSVSAGISNFDSVQAMPTISDTCAFSVKNSAGTVIYCIDANGNTTIAGGVAKEGQIALPLYGFALGNQSGSPVAYPDTSHTPISVAAGTSAVVGYSTVSGFASIGWPANNSIQTPVSMAFRIPSNFYSGGAFRILAAQSLGGLSPVSVLFDVWVERQGRTPPSNTLVQTPVMLNGIYTTSPQEAVIIPAGDTYFTALAAGDWVKIRLWRPSMALTGSTATLHIVGAEFYYTPK